MIECTGKRRGTEPGFAPLLCFWPKRKSSAYSAPDHGSGGKRVRLELCSQVCGVVVVVVGVHGVQRGGAVQLPPPYACPAGHSLCFVLTERPRWALVKVLGFGDILHAKSAVRGRQQKQKQKTQTNQFSLRFLNDAPFGAENNQGCRTQEEASVAWKTPGQVSQRSHASEPSLVANGCPAWA